MKARKAYPSATGNWGEQEHFVAIFQYPGPMVPQRSQVHSRHCDEAACRDPIAAGQLLGYCLQGIIHRGPIAKAQSIGHGRGRIITMAHEHDLHVQHGSTPGREQRLAEGMDAAPQQGQLGLRTNCSCRLTLRYPSIAHKHPKLGQPAPESILIASRAASEPIDAEMAPTTGNISSNSGAAG